LVKGNPEVTGKIKTNKRFFQPKHPTDKVSDQSGVDSKSPKVADAVLRQASLGEEDRPSNLETTSFKSHCIFSLSKSRSQLPRITKSCEDPLSCGQFHLWRLHERWSQYTIA
jgi:hypothetical protein